MSEVRQETREYLDGLFTPGVRIGGDPHTPYSWIEIAELKEVTTIRLPSGRLVVDSPWSTGAPRELAVRVPPGEYPVDVSWADWPRLADGYYTEHRMCAATRLRVRDEPVATWQLALGVGEDPALRSAGAGYDAEEAMGCFADATAWQALTGPFRQGPAAERGTEDLCEGHFELLRDEEHRADLLTFGVPEGWGQVWEGLARDGGIAAIVAPGPVPTSPWD
ncbi:DUF4241 domain-containing protein [Kitasatospora sp. NPDC127116]|uniref:DUF4241 domain-containing protein n=1 Tax=Kitasatospora sp. NPDC127116 TaxID=3345367 RepID=UPI003378CCFB